MSLRVAQLRERLRCPCKFRRATWRKFATCEGWALVAQVCHVRIPQAATSKVALQKQEPRRRLTFFAVLACLRT